MTTTLVALTDAAHASFSPEVEVSDAAVTRALERRAEQLVRTHYGFVWRTARGMGISAADAEDLAQRVMIAAARRIRDIEEGKEKAFLYRTTCNLVRRAFRSRFRRPEDASEDVVDSVAPGPAPDELIEQRRGLQEFERIVALLPEKLRLTFLLYEVEGATQPEIAEAMGARLGTVASRIRRAKELFQRHASGPKAARRGGTP